MYQNGEMVAEYRHDLTFEDYFGVTIIAHLDGTATIEVSSGEDSFREEDVTWPPLNGTPFVQNLGEYSLIDCTLSYYCNGWDKDIWLYGDSYFSLTEADRWTTYLVQNGSDNILLSARSGKGSEEALISFKNDLCHGTPRTVVWCMGMNDGDTDEAANADWLAATEEVISICEEKGIELILSTIPTNPYWYNDYKNEYVKSSGYRYIDFASVVGAYDNLEWNEGMLEQGEKRIHPTEAGAIALYHQAVATVPKLLGQ